MKNVILSVLLGLMIIILLELHSNNQYMELLYGEYETINLRINALKDLVEWHEEQLSGEFEVEIKKELTKF
jgi:hypothetical protein